METIKMPCSKEEIMKNWEDSGRICEWQSYQQLLKKFKEASQKGNIERMAEIKTELHDLCRLCGAFPLPEIMRILEDVELSENDLTYIRNSLPFIERCADSLDFKTMNTLVRDINRITGCTCQQGEHDEKIDFAAAMMRGFTNIQGAVSPMTTPNLEEDRREAQYPEFCSDKCEHVTCPYRRQENFNLPCKARWQPLKRSFDPREE
jgi:hypothetical protein